MARSQHGFGHDSPKNLTHDWYTPPWIFEAMGLEFDLDVAAPKDGVPWIPAPRWFSILDNGLVRKWEGLVWCNPPYGKQTEHWLSRMHEHRNGVALVFARTDTKWYHEYVSKADAILFLRGRVKFVDAFGVTGESGAGAGSMLVAWGEGVRGLENMRDMGHIIRGDI